MKIVTISQKTNEAFLRTKTKPFNLDSISKKDLKKLIGEMKIVMRDAHGIGLSANQVGEKECFFIATVPDAHGRSKFYAIFNPEIEKTSSETLIIEEGCLSVPGKFGEVERPEKITIKGFDIDGKRIRIKAWGLLARVFQHEIDHLNGVLYIDRAERIYSESQSERLKK